MAALIEVDRVSKEFELGADQVSYGNLRESLGRALGWPLRALRGQGRRRRESFLALREVSFEVERGQAVGIIGRNGAGKSTLLKLLSRITAPSAGEIRLRGRVASLLEVGTGFHPELTGRENIFLNGAILGMKRAEIRTSFDAIVEFAEIGRFIDTPVKRYSSGMYVRLAFAVAAHLRPEILIVDEVLAVGDTAFQKKCLGKMQDVAEGGRTVLFVSHNMAAVSRLCSRAILLQGGQVAADGPVEQVIGSYLSGSVGESPASVEFASPPGNEHVRLLAARLSGGERPGQVDIRRPVVVELDYRVRSPGLVFHPHVTLHGETGECVLVTTDATEPASRRPRPPGRYRSRLVLPGNFLSEGMCSVDVAVCTLDPFTLHVSERGALAFHVHDPGEGDSVRAHHGGHWPGVVRPLLPWSTERVSEPGDDGPPEPGGPGPSG
ncbi:MAG: ATP-binding cassette domain-containing protein [Myxococcales bacterium]|nr:MAG: ATP-binding cassette domain-containing protein [Myxococcales bacterium]